MLGMPRQYLSIALMLSYKLDFSCCADMDDFPRPSHIYKWVSRTLKYNYYIITDPTQVLDFEDSYCM